MISFYIKSMTYEKNKLIEYFKPFFESNRDVELFISSLLETNQISRKGDIFYFPATHTKTLLKPRYYRFQLISGGGEDRVSIRGGREFTERVGFPSEVYIYKYIKRNVWMPIPEQPSLRLSKGRLPETLESWRAQVPLPISREYGLKPGHYVAARIDSVTIEYFCLLTLWGFEHEEVLTFSYEKNPTNERHIELKGIMFISEVSGRNIVEQTERIGERIQSIMDGLLYADDREYFEAAHHPDFDTVMGSILIPLKERTFKFPDVKFTDLDREEVLLEWTTRRSFDRIPEQNEFILKRTKIKPRRVPGKEWW